MYYLLSHLVQWAWTDFAAPAFCLATTLTCLCSRVVSEDWPLVHWCWCMADSARRRQRMGSDDPACLVQGVRLCSFRHLHSSTVGTATPLRMKACQLLTAVNGFAKPKVFRQCHLHLICRPCRGCV